MPSFYMRFIIHNIQAKTKPLPFYLFPPRQQPRPKGRGILRLNNYIDNYLYFYILLVFLCLKSF